MNKNLKDKMEKLCISGIEQTENRKELLETLTEFLQEAEFSDLSSLNEVPGERSGILLTAEVIALIGAYVFQSSKFTVGFQPTKLTGKLPKLS